MNKEPEDFTKGWSSTWRPKDGATSFTANGREYRISRSISFDRYEAYELLQVEVGLARTFEHFNEQIREAYDLCNQVATGKPVFADLSVLLRDMMIGVQLVGEAQTPAVLKLCALFINREGEDVRTIDDATVDSKINDWRESGIDIRYFFGFALHSIPGFIEALKAASIATSSQGQPEGRAAGSTSSNASSRSAT